MFKVIVNARFLALWGILFVAAFVCRSSLAARPGITILDVDNVNDSGPGSLRQTILDADGTGGPHVLIQFTIPGSGPFTINVPSPLPSATRSIDFDGSAQSITLQGTGSGNGLDLRFGGTVNALTIRGFGNGIYVQDVTTTITNCVIGGNDTGISLLNVNGSVINRCRIGTNAAGDAVDENMVGIKVFGGQSVIIGGGDPTNAIAANLISGNRIGGVYAEGTSFMWMAQNLVGTNLAGTSPLPNPYNDEAPGIPDPDTNVFGVKLVSCDHMQIGEDALWYGNLITGFQKDIYLDNVSDSTIRRNFIGLNKAGNTPIPNPFAYWGPGAPIVGIDAPDSHGNQVFNGTDVYMHACTNTQIEHSTLANSTRYGVEMDGCIGCALYGNLIGTLVDGFTPAGGTAGGAMLFFHNGSGNFVGPGYSQPNWVSSSQGPADNVVCAYGNGTDMIAESNETALVWTDTFGYGIDGVTPIGHAHVFLHVGGSTLTNNKSTGIALGQTVIPNCDRAICVSNLAEPQGFADTFNPFGSYDPTWSNDRISWPTLDAASPDGIVGHYQLPAGRAVTFNFYRSDAPGSFALAGSYSLSAAANLGAGTFIAPVSVGVGQTMYAATVDSNGSTSEFSVPIVGTPNSPPIAAAGVNQNVTVPHDGNPATNTASVVLDGSGSSDPDAGQTLTYVWKDQSNAVIGTTTQVSINLTAGTYNYTLTVTDPFGRTSTSSTQVTVAGELDAPPTSIVGPDHTITVLYPATTATVALDGSASSDPDNDTLSYSWSDGLGVIGTTPTLSLVKGFGTYNFTLTVTDPYGKFAIATVTITVNSPNQPPNANAGSDVIATVPHDGNPATNTKCVTLNGTGSSDPDAGQTLTYEWRDQSNAVVGNSAQVAVNMTAGSYTFTLTVTDPFGEHSSSVVHVTVNAEQNSGPTVNGGADASVPSGSTFVRTATYGDADNDAVQLAWREGATLLSSTATLSTALSVGTHTLTVTATDSYGVSATDTVVVTVNVNYGWHGFDQPINNDNSSIFKLNSTIPVKFSLTNGTPVAHLYVAKITNAVIGTEVEAVGTGNADTGNTFRYSGGGYIFNLSTKSLSVGTWQLRVDLGDGDNTHTVLISIR